MSKELIKIFDKLCYANNASTVFDDLLTVTMTQFVPAGLMDDWHSKAVERLKKKELINEFVFSLISKYQTGIDINGWCDPWGDLYQEITSNYKASALGQYFTPVHLSTLCAQMQIVDQPMEGKTINDPACGSGRMLLAFYSQRPYNYFFGEDLDLICCKMTAVNMAFHGMIGEVINHNTLTEPKTLRYGWRVQNIGLPVPAIVPIKAEQSFICSGNEWFKPVESEHINKLKAVFKFLEETPKEEPKADIIVNKEIVEQMSLFSDVA